MAVFHYLHLRAFAHETEDPERVRQALRHAAQADLPLEETDVEGGHKNRVRILEGEVRSAPAAKRMFERLAQDDAEGFERLRTEATRRTDENLNFHFRLDKQEAYLGRLRLGETDDAIAVRAKLRSFESRRSGAQSAQAAASLADFLEKAARFKSSRILGKEEDQPWT
ncbi:MAG TPA: RNA-binding domain-containing protein [Candidatus Thermoplasmatota archaeon]|nr:RNA-binding domain-containing protein [Candidatus Thermoplasmatota archaeon]